MTAGKCGKCGCQQ